jgi:hypothetical protein
MPSALAPHPRFPRYAHTGQVFYISSLLLCLLKAFSDWPKVPRCFGAVCMELITCSRQLFTRDIFVDPARPIGLLDIRILSGYRTEASHILIFYLFLWTTRLLTSAWEGEQKTRAKEAAAKQQVHTICCLLSSLHQQENAAFTSAKTTCQT